MVDLLDRLNTQLIKSRDEMNGRTLEFSWTHHRELYLRFDNNCFSIIKMRGGHDHGEAPYLFWQPVVYKQDLYSLRQLRVITDNDIKQRQQEQFEQYVELGKDPEWVEYERLKRKFEPHRT